MAGFEVTLIGRFWVIPEVDWVDHAFEDGVLYLHVRFTDKTELCWRIGTSLAIDEADLSDWKTGNFKQLAIFAERELDPHPEQ